MKWSLVCFQLALLNLCYLTKAREIQASSDVQSASEADEFGYRFVATEDNVREVGRSDSVGDSYRLIVVESENEYDEEEETLEIEPTSTTTPKPKPRPEPGFWDQLTQGVMSGLQTLGYGKMGGTSAMGSSCSPADLAAQVDSALKSALAKRKAATQRVKTTKATPTSTTESPIDSKVLLTFTRGELTDLARWNPKAMGVALPNLVEFFYGGNASNFETVFDFVAHLPTYETQIIGFSAIWNVVQQYAPIPEPALLVKLTESLKRQQMSEVKFTNLISSTTKADLADLVQDLRPLMVIGRESQCVIRNVAYGRILVTGDQGHPQSAYLLPDTTWVVKWTIKPSVQTGRLTFRIRFFSHLYASGINPNVDEGTEVYQTKLMERYVLHDTYSDDDMPGDLEIEWRLVPAGYAANQFKILSAEFGDVMFAMNETTANGRGRRVLLARNSGEEGYIPGADLWEFDC